MLPSPHALGRPPHFDAQIARQILSQCDAPLTHHPQETGLRAIFAVFYRSHFQTDQAAADHYGIPRQRFAEWKPAIEPLRNDADLSATLGGVQQVPGNLHVQGTIYAQAFERSGVNGLPGISPPVSFPPSPPASMDSDASNLPPESANIIQANIPVSPTSPKFYFAVKGGPSPGVYNSWPEAIAHGAQGVPGVSQKKFTTPYEAEAFVTGAIIIKAPVLNASLHFDHDPPIAEIERRHKAQNAIRKHEGSFNIASAQGNMKCSIVIKSDMCDEVWFINSPAEMHEVGQTSWFIEASFSGASPSTPISIDVKIISEVANQKQSILVRDSITPQDGHVISVPLSGGLNYNPDTFILEVNISRPNANLPTFTI